MKTIDLLSDLNNLGIALWHGAFYFLGTVIDEGDGLALIRSAIANC